MDMLKNIGKQSRESVESVLKKERKAMVGRICRKERFLDWNERVRVMDDESGESMELMKEVPLIGLAESQNISPQVLS